MKVLTLTILSLLTFAAQAGSFSCVQIGDSTNSKFSVVTNGEKLVITTNENLDQLMPTQTLTVDRTYKPRAKNAGSLRYNGEGDFGSFELVIDAKMASDKSGRMSLKSYADSDGGAPAFLYFACNRK